MRRVLLASALTGHFLPLPPPFSPQDFNVTAPSISVDTSAAMIAADGMIEIAWNTADPAKRASYLAFAKATLDSVVEAYTFSADQNDAVLANGTVTFPLAGISIIYADYYLLEASMRWDATPLAWRQEAVEYMAKAGW